MSLWFFLQVAQQTYIELDEKLFDHFLEEKSNPIVGALEQNMYAGRFDWNDCLQSIGVRRYLKDALMGIIEVHAEVSTNGHIFVVDTYKMFIFLHWKS